MYRRLRGCGSFLFRAALTFALFCGIIAILNGLVPGPHAVGAAGGIPFLSGLVILPIALWIMTRRIWQGHRRPRRRQTDTAPLSTGDLIGMLDDDDIEDLRDEIRETLRARIRRLEGSEEITFEALLDTAKAKRKRDGRVS